VSAPGDHRPELPDLKPLAVAPDASPPEDDRPAAVELDQERDQHEERREQRQQDGRAAGVEAAF